MKETIQFVGVGPQRTGTTWLDNLLRKHPQLCLPEGVKETRFFDLYYEKGLAWYKAHFSERESEKLSGEIAPTYFNSLKAPKRIHAINPNTKVIINLRVPVSRIHSLYRHHIFRGHANGSFMEVVSSWPHLIDSGKYAQHIPRWQNWFDNNVIVILFDDIVSSPEIVLERLYDFLDIVQISVPEDIRSKKGDISPPRFPFLAKLGVKLANSLHGFRFHTVVEMGKVIVINDLLLSGGKHKLPSLTIEEKKWILRKHEADIAYVESLLGRELKQWRTMKD